LLFLPVVYPPWGEKKRRRRVRGGKKPSKKGARIEGV